MVYGMSRSLKKLTARQVATLEAPGRHADGGGLYLELSSGGLRRWVFVTAHAGEPLEIRLGGELSVSLATARRLAGEMREAVAAGQDPRTVMTPSILEERNTIPTFGAFARSYITSAERGWKNPKNQQSWRNTLRDHAKLLLGKPIDQIGIDDVFAVLNPIWLVIPQTARRLRGRIETILEAARACGYRPKDAMNPAARGGHLFRLLPAASKLLLCHFPALSWRQAPAFIAELRLRQALAARCLEFVILTASRSGEGLGCTWSEIDFELSIWNIPAERTSAGVAHAVPLSSAAIALLKNLRPEVWQPDRQVFAVNGAPLSDRAMSMLLRRMKRDSVTTYGFRSTFKEWAGNATNYPSELVERALAHTAPIRSAQVCTLEAEFVCHRELMEAWSEFLNSHSHLS